MSYSAPNSSPYESSLMPISTRSITVLRGDGSTAGGGGSPTTVGTYLAENCNITRPATVVDRKGISGEDQAAPTIIRGAIKWSSKIQIATAPTNSVRPGDYFEESIDVDAAAASANKVRFVINSCVKDETAGTPHTYSIEATEDAPHSTQYGGS
jgi:hypothetical protein